MKEFNIEVLNKIIANLEKQGKLFANKEQLQFEIAIALKDNNYDVELEVLSMSHNEIIMNEKGEKLYTDIVVSLGDNKYVAIELKYKLKQRHIVYNVNNKNIFAFPQGAYNIGSYAFLKDVERLERLTRANREDKILFNFNKENKIIKSYALLFTNDKNYFTESSDKNNLNKDYKLVGEKTGELYNYVAIDENGNRIKRPSRKQRQKLVAIKDENDCIKYFNRLRKDKMPINLKGKYFCDWKDYNLQGCENYGNEFTPKFKYLLLEIDNI